MAHPTPRDLLRKYGFSPKKSWGQNFLHDVPTQQRIVAASGAEVGRTVLEIGPGLGHLTAQLLETGAKVVAIERDRDMCQVLREELGGQDNFELHEADAVRFDYASVASIESRPPVIGNLPYQLTGPLLFRLLEFHHQTGPWTVMIQKEVADRLCALPGEKDYGGITAAISRVRSIFKVCNVGRACFVPPPRVDSAVIRLDPRDQPRGEVANEKALLHLIRTAFQGRRKTLSNCLKSLGTKEEVETWITQADLDPKIRPERLRPEDFAALQRARESLLDPT